MKGWKTLLFAVAVAVIGALEAFDFTQMITGESAGIWIGIIGLVIGFLRKVTTSPIGVK